MPFRKAPGDEEQWKFDGNVHAITTIPEPHRMVHEGFFFHCSFENLTLADATAANTLLTIPAGISPHIRAAVGTISDGPATVELFEGTTVSANGTLKTTFNQNRTLAATLAQMTVHAGPTITDDGTRLIVRLMPSLGGTKNEERGTAIESFGEEWVFAEDTKYLLRVTNRSGGTIEAAIAMQWYEIGFDIP